MDLSSMIRVYGRTPYKPIQNLFTSTHKCHHKTRIKILESVFWSSDGQQMAQWQEQTTNQHSPGLRVNRGQNQNTPLLSRYVKKVQ